MPTVKRTEKVEFSQQQMYELVNNIDDYPQFVPACIGSQKRVVNDNEIEATLEFSRGGIDKSFTTRNRLQPYERIDIELVDGPFKHLEGFWYFVPKDEQQCEIQLDLEFEFSSGWLSMAFGPVFNQVANKLVQVFHKRAEQVYGQPRADT